MHAGRAQDRKGHAEQNRLRQHQQGAGRPLPDQGSGGGFGERQHVVDRQVRQPQVFLMEKQSEQTNHELDQTIGQNQTNGRHRHAACQPGTDCHAAHEN
ncbi:MAG: hypothetical protein AB7V26_09460 [Lysobacterales bacterium]